MKKLIKECPYLCVLVVFFSIAAYLSIVGALTLKQLNKEFWVARIETPFWVATWEMIDDALRPVSVPEPVNIDVEVADSESDGETSVVEHANQPETTAEATPGIPMAPAEPKAPVGVTVFEEYTPIPVDSIYYGDSGLHPVTTDYPYIEILPEDLADACFIGDSRVVGLYDYCDLAAIADFYCDTGYSMYDWAKGEKITYRRTGQKVDLLGEMANHDYKKIYIMMGVNDLGYVDSSSFHDRLVALYDCIRNQHPDAIIYLMGNMYMSEKKCKGDVVYNNVNINDKNVRIAQLADGIHSFYLDVNPLYVDDNGYLDEEYTFDGCHVYGNLYGPWKAFILSHVVK